MATHRIRSETDAQDQTHHMQPPEARRARGRKPYEVRRGCVRFATEIVTHHGGERLGGRLGDVGGASV
jgi:hypothetical protein